MHWKQCPQTADPKQQLETAEPHEYPQNETKGSRGQPVLAANPGASDIKKWFVFATQRTPLIDTPAHIMLRELCRNFWPWLLSIAFITRRFIRKPKTLFFFDDQIIYNKICLIGLGHFCVKSERWLKIGEHVVNGPHLFGEREGSLTTELVPLLQDPCSFFLETYTKPTNTWLKIQNSPWKAEIWFHSQCQGTGVLEMHISKLPLNAPRWLDLRIKKVDTKTYTSLKSRAKHV